MTGYGNHTPVLKRHMEPELTEKLHSITFRATKAECLDLPETIDIIRYVELEDDADKHYKNIAKDSYTELRRAEQMLRSSNTVTAARCISARSLI